MLYPYIGSDNDVRVPTGTHIVSYQPHEDQDPDTPCIEVTQTTNTDITLNEAKRLRSALDDAIDAARLDIRCQQLGIYPVNDNDNQ